MTDSRPRITQLSDERGAPSCMTGGGAGKLRGARDMRATDVIHAVHLFDKGKNTNQIADRLMLSEAQIYNVLAKSREGRRAW